MLLRVLPMRLSLMRLAHLCLEGALDLLLDGRHPLVAFLGARRGELPALLVVRDDLQAAKWNCSRDF